MLDLRKHPSGESSIQVSPWYYDANGRLIDQTCDMYPGTAHWYDLTTGYHVSNSNLPPQTAHDYTWTGTYRTLQGGHVYAVKQSDFHVQFYKSPGYISNYHTICSYKVT